MLDLAYLNGLRRLEIEEVLRFFPPGSRVLEFGSGTGEQARFLQQQGFDVCAIDLPSSNYAHCRVFPVQDYDGAHIPLADHSIDVIFSSNVLEHVENFGQISAEFRRVLRPEGIAVHVLPTTAWRFWTFATNGVDSVNALLQLPRHVFGWLRFGNARKRLIPHLRRAASGFVPRGHGTSPEGLSELWTFSRTAWRRRFRKYGFEVVSDEPLGLFYTGTMLRGGKLDLERRRSLSRKLGSSAHVYVLKRAGAEADDR